MNPEVQYALSIAALGAICTILLFLWGVLDFKTKLKKLDKVDNIDGLVSSLGECIKQLNEMIRRQDVQEAISKGEFKRMSQDISELKIRVWRLEQRSIELRKTEVPE